MKHDIRMFYFCSYSCGEHFCNPPHVREEEAVMEKERTLTRIKAVYVPNPQRPFRLVREAPDWILFEMPSPTHDRSVSHSNCKQ